MVEFISRDSISFGSAKCCIWVSGLNMKYTCFNFVDPCNHSEGSSIHEVDQNSGWTLRLWCGCVGSWQC